MSAAAETQSQQPQFYKQVAALSNEGHADWKVKPTTDFGYAADTNAVLITAVEFPLAAREYPIVFIESGDSVLPVAVLGLQPGQNLYLSKENSWDAKYIPAYVRRYPFILAGDKPKTGEVNYTVCLDEAYQGFDRESGEALFTDSGEQSEFLQKVVAFLKDYQTQGLFTEKLCKTLKKLDVLEPMQANLNVKKGEGLTVAGFMVVNRDKLKAKKPLELAELVKSDEMELIYHHLASLSNFNSLTSRFSRTK